MMMTQEVFLTEDGRQRALTQLDALRTVKRAEVAQYLQEAKEDGDVIDNAAYDDANVQIAHLACNWAKNECADDQFDEWLAVVRGAEVE